MNNSLEPRPDNEAPSDEEMLAQLKQRIELLEAQAVQQQFQLQAMEGLIRELQAVAKTGSIRNGAWQHVRDRLLSVQFG